MAPVERSEVLGSMFYNRWSPSPKSKSPLAQRAAEGKPLFLKGLAGSPKAAKPAKGADKGGKKAERTWNHAEPKQIIRTFTY